MNGACCSPSLPSDRGPAAASRKVEPSPMPLPPGLRLIPLRGGRFRMGSEDGIFPADGEAPVRAVTLSAFAISAHAVTNAQFAAFATSTGYRTDAERTGSSFVFAGFVAPGSSDAVRGPAAGTPWWVEVAGASWQTPEGPGSSIDDRDDHPVVHVSHHDALAFCTTHGLRLPTEAEWEFAARGDLEQCRYPWGDELMPDGRWCCNVWQGSFPGRNTAEDGFAATAPVDTFAPNGYGLFNMVGNVWEWCSDWFSARPPARPACDPAGPAAGTSRVIRGGSYLCHESYCFRYRVAARSFNTPDSSTAHAGFRVARSLSE
jgi:formylglycine-generating enzyme